MEGKILILLVCELIRRISLALRTYFAYFVLDPLRRIPRDPIFVACNILYIKSIINIRLDIVKTSDAFVRVLRVSSWNLVYKLDSCKWNSVLHFHARWFLILPHRNFSRYTVHVCWKFGERQIIVIITLKGNLRKEINFQRVENFWSKYIRGRGKIGIVYQCQKQKLEAPS